MAATTVGGEATTAGAMEMRETLDMEVSGGTAVDDGSGAKKCRLAPADEAGGTCDARVRAHVVEVGDDKEAGGAELQRATKAGVAAVGQAEEGARQGGEAEAAHGGTCDATSDQDLLIRPKNVKEFWCLREPRVYPKAAAAAKAVRHEVLEAWGEQPQLKGFPTEMLVFDKTQSKEAAPAATGMIKVSRAAFDGWQSPGWERLIKNAWPVMAGIEQCRLVKAFGANTDHARELNWVMGTLGYFLEAGNSLSINASDISFGYAELPSRVARLNGSEWGGYVYGVNLPLHDLLTVVEWGVERDKELKSTLKSELKVDAERRSVISSSILPGEAGYKFHSADFIAGSFTVLIESKLGMADFDLEAYEEVVGMDILCDIFGEHVVLDITPSVGGLMGTRIVRVRVKCGLRFEKAARALVNSLVAETYGTGSSKVFLAGTEKFELKFYPEEAARSMAEQAEGRQGGGTGRSESRALQELSAVTQALSELKEVQAKTSQQMASLAEEQHKAVVANSKQIEGLAEQQAKAAEGTEAKFASTQAQLAALAEVQRVTMEENAKRMAEVADAQKQAFMFSNLIQNQLAESLAQISAIGHREIRTKTARPELQVAMENVPPDRSAAARWPGVASTCGQLLGARFSKKGVGGDFGRASDGLVCLQGLSTNRICTPASQYKAIAEVEAQVELLRDCERALAGPVDERCVQHAAGQLSRFVGTAAGEVYSEVQGKVSRVQCVGKARELSRFDSREEVHGVFARSVSDGGSGVHPRRVRYSGKAGRTCAIGSSRCRGTVVRLLCLLGSGQLAEGFGLRASGEGLGRVGSSNSNLIETLTPWLLSDDLLGTSRIHGSGRGSQTTLEGRVGAGPASGSSHWKQRYQMGSGELVPFDRWRRQQEGVAAPRCCPFIRGGGTVLGGSREQATWRGGGAESVPLATVVAPPRSLLRGGISSAVDAFSDARCLAIHRWKIQECVDCGEFYGSRSGRHQSAQSGSPTRRRQVGGWTRSSTQGGVIAFSPEGAWNTSSLLMARGGSGGAFTISTQLCSCKASPHSSRCHGEGLGCVQKKVGSGVLIGGAGSCAATVWRRLVPATGETAGYLSQSPGGGAILETGSDGQGLHAHIQQVLCGCQSYCAAQGSTGGRSGFLPGMGHLARCSCESQSSIGATGSDAGSGKGNRRAGGSLPSDDVSDPADLQEIRASGQRERSRQTELRVPVLWNRHWRCGGELSVRGQVVLPARGRDSWLRPRRPATSMGRQAGEMHGRRIGCGDKSGAASDCGAGRHIVHELAMRAVVVGEYNSTHLSRSSSFADEGGRGDAGVSAGCGACHSQGDHHRMRCWASGSALPYALGMDLQFAAPLDWLAMVVAASRPIRDMRRKLAQETPVGGWCPVGRRESHLSEWVMAALAGCISYAVANRWKVWSPWPSDLTFRIRCRGSQGTAATGSLGRFRVGCCGRQKLGRQCGSSGACRPKGDRRSNGADTGASNGQQRPTDQQAERSYGGDRGTGESGDGSDGGASSVAPATNAHTTTGTCLCWNARQLCMYVPRGIQGSSASYGGTRPGSVVNGKLGFLAEQMDLLCPWLVAVMEVDDACGRMKALRSWFRRRGYEMVHLPGEGSSKGSGGRANGILVAASKEIQLVESKRLAFRVLAVVAAHKGTGQMLHVAIMHGASTEGSEVDEHGEGCWSFTQQLKAAAEWSRAHDGALLMDANRIPCRAWRRPAATSLNKGDQALRRLLCWDCSCCPTLRDESEGDAVLIGRCSATGDDDMWTRWGSGPDGASSAARLDFGVAFGTARDTWLKAALCRPHPAVSDHAMVAYELSVSAAGGPRGETRPLPVRLGPAIAPDEDHACVSPWAWMGRLAAQEGFREMLADRFSDAEAKGTSIVEALVPIIRALGEEAVRKASECKDAARGAHGSVHGRTVDSRSDMQVWARRLKLAQAIHLGSHKFTLRDWSELCHPRSGLRRYCPYFSDTAAEAVDWPRIIRRCRRQWDRAQAAIVRRNRDEDAKLANLCHRLESSLDCADCNKHINTLWRMISGRKGSDRMRKLYVGDEKGAPVVLMSDAEFLAEAGRIGEKFVACMDRGYCENALRGWLRVFASRSAAGEGCSGSWDVAKDFDFNSYLQVLRAMRGKAVGAGGLSVELLLAAGREVQWRFFQAISSDVSSGRLASHWRRVLYVLLRKPAPNDPDIVAQRREIALMPQDLKVLLQGIRRRTFTKIGETLCPEQYGWKPGFGCADPSLALSVTLQQARRLGHPVYVLYIDLANFFPAINRKAADICEEWAGLPARVADIMRDVYGSPDNPQDAVRCQYETEAGLGVEFRNHMGRLMGCPLSPDSAKILLNTIIVAIKRSVTGVALWPFDGAELLQVAYADDWVGLFDDAEQLLKAWDLWLSWAAIIGARLGIKGLLKTVVSCSCVDHLPTVPSLPKLRNLDGEEVPVLDAHKLYKHLGIPRATNADGKLAWEGGHGVIGIRDKLKACICRIKKLRRRSTSVEQFMSISNVLLGGLASVYLQASPVTFDETEEIERRWRGVFCRFARRDPRAPVAEMYAPSAGWRKGRTHIYSVGSAALFAAVEKAMAEPVASPAREAVRSAVALSLFSWGCRSDPNQWSWRHLGDELRKSLRGRHSRYVGDAWMLAVLDIEQRCDPARSEMHRDGEMRVQTWGRWRGMCSNGGVLNPLSADNEAFQGGSTTLFDPPGSGGLGLKPCAELLRLGIAELKDVCNHAVRGSGLEGRWIRDRKGAAARTGKGRLTAGEWRAWEDLIAEVAAVEVEPAYSDATSGGLWLRYVRYRRSAGDTDSRARLLRSVRRHDDASSDAPAASVPAEVWEARLRKGFTPRRATRSQEAESSCEELHHTAIGWRMDEGEDFIDRGLLETDTFPAAWRNDWRSRKDELLSKVRFSRKDGWPLIPTGADGEGYVKALAPPLQLAVRARLMLGDDAAVLPKGRGCKIPGWRVALDAQLYNWETLCDLQARFEFQFAFAVDASSGFMVDDKGAQVRDSWGWPTRSTSAAAVGHDGSCLGGRLDPRLPSNNYLGELVALVVALRSVPAGSNVLLIFDATSPLKAWRRFRRRCTRAKWAYKAAPYLEELDQLVGKMRLIYFLWQSSHCGSPVNEVADIEAERLRLEDSADLLIEAGGSRLFAMWPARPCGAIFGWAKSAMAEVVLERLQARSGHDPILVDEDDWELSGWSEQEGIMLSAMRCSTLFAGDKGHKDEAFGERATARMGCPLGCTAGASTWWHYAFSCEDSELRSHRAWWREWIIRNRHTFDGLGLHRQVEAVLSLCRSPPQDAAGGGGGGKERLAHRLLAGAVEKVALRDDAETSRARAAVGDMIRGGLELLSKAVEMEEGLRRQTVARILDNRKLAKAVRHWKRRCARIGPCKAAALFHVRLWRTVAEKAVALRVSEGTLSRPGALAFLSRLQLLIAEALAAVRATIKEGSQEKGVAWFCAYQWFKAVARRPRREVMLNTGWPVLTDVAAEVISIWPGAAHLSLAWHSKTIFLRGVSCADGSGIRIKLPIPGLRDRMLWSLRSWVKHGGGPLLWKVRRARAAHEAAALKERRRAQLEQAKLRLHNFCQGRACSGGALPSIPEEERVTIEVVARRKRSRAQFEWEQGIRANRRGWWAVESVMQVRKVEPGSRRWEARVEWKGPHETSWVAIANLRGTARSDATELIAQTAGPAHRARAVHGGRENRGAGDGRAPLGTRRSPRLLEGKRGREVCVEVLTGLTVRRRMTDEPSELNTSVRDLAERAPEDSCVVAGGRVYAGMDSSS